VKQAGHSGFGDFDDGTRSQSGGGSHAQMLAAQARFAKESLGLEDADDAFLPLAGDNRQLDASFQNVENGVPWFALGKNQTAFFIGDDSPSRARGGQKKVRI